MAIQAMKAVKKHAVAAAAADDDAAPAKKVMKAMKVRKAKQVISITPNEVPAKKGKVAKQTPAKHSIPPAKKGKFAKKTIAAKRTTDKKKKTEDETVVAAADDDAPPAKKVMKAMKAGKAKQVISITPNEVPAKKGKVAKQTPAKHSIPPAKKGKFAKKTLAAKRTTDKKKKTEDETVAARTAELKSMSAADLKELALKKGLEKSLKGEMMESILAQEATERQAACAYEAKVRDVIAEKRKDIESKTIPELKELCEAKNLKSGGSKLDKVERLLAAAQQEGEIDKILADMARAARREELIAMSNANLQALCKKSGIDPVMKEVMVDRIISHEALAKA